VGALVLSQSPLRVEDAQTARDQLGDTFWFRFAPNTFVCALPTASRRSPLFSSSSFTSAMAHLPTRSFQAYQVFAANTNVGKTILSTGLVRAAASLSIGADKQRKRAFYLKPVQTGYPVDCDARHV